MKYCPHCRRFNQGNPARCRFCGRTWSYRICNRGHINPPNAIYCGECGSPDLTQTSSSTKLALVKGVVLLLVVIVVYSLISSINANSFTRLGKSLVTFVVFVSIMLIAFKLSMRIMPKQIASILKKISKLTVKNHKKSKRMK